MDIVFTLTGGLEAVVRLKCEKLGDFSEREVTLSNTWKSEFKVANRGVGDFLYPIGVAA